MFVDHWSGADTSKLRGIQREPGRTCAFRSGALSASSSACSARVGRHNQCEGGLCVGGVCTKPCTIAQDSVNNLTGAVGPDGIEDPGQPSQCGGAVKGTMGGEFRCVEQNSPAQVLIGQTDQVCLPGTTFAPCAANSDCQAGEVCRVIGILADYQARCSPRQSNPVGTAGVKATQYCNDYPAVGAVGKPVGVMCLATSCSEMLLAKRGAYSAQSTTPVCMAAYSSFCGTICAATPSRLKVSTCSRLPTRNFLRLSSSSVRTGSRQNRAASTIEKPRKPGTSMFHLAMPSLSTALRAGSALRCSSALATRAPPQGAVMTMAETSAELELPMERPLYTPTLKVALSDSAPQAGEGSVDLGALYDQVVVDQVRLRRHIRQALQSRTQVTLRELAELQPLEHGLAELVAYLQLAEDSFEAVVDESVTETIRWQGAVDEGEGSVLRSEPASVTVWQPRPRVWLC